MNFFLGKVNNTNIESNINFETLLISVMIDPKILYQLKTLSLCNSDKFIEKLNISTTNKIIDKLNPRQINNIKLLITSLLSP